MHCVSCHTIFCLSAFLMIFLVFSQMEDGHTMFDYSVGLNDIVQLLVRQAAAVVNDKDKSKDKEAELSDSDSGCGSAQSESDKNSTHGEAESQAAGTSAQVEAPELVDPGFGLYKVRFLGCLMGFNRSTQTLKKIADL